METEPGGEKRDYGMWGGYGVATGQLRGSYGVAMWYCGGSMGCSIRHYRRPMADLWGSMGLYSLLLHFRVQSNPKLLLGHLEEDDIDRLGPTGQKYGTIWGCPTEPHHTP